MREVFGGQAVALAMQAGAEQHAGKLTNVAGPAVAHEHRQRVIADRQRRDQLLLRKPLQQVTGQGWNVAAPIAQRGKCTTVTQTRSPSIWLKLSGSGVLDVAITRTSIEELPLHPTGRTSPVARTRSSVSCSRAWKGGDLIENERAHVRLEHAAASLREGARKGTLHMAKEFAVHDICGYGFAVDDHHRALGAKACGVDRASDRFLARSRLADDQDRQAIAGGFGGDGERRAIFGRGADQLLERQRRGQLLGNRDQLANGFAAVGIGGERLDQAFGRDRTRQEIGCAGAHCVDGFGDGLAFGGDDDREIGALGA